MLLAGAGSRVPLIQALVQDLMKKQGVPAIFPVIDDPPRPKEKVAAGLARYYERRLTAEDLVEGIDRSSNHTNADIVWSTRDDRELVLVESCALLNSDEPVKVTTGIPLGRLFRTAKLKRLYVARAAFPQNIEIGYFDLSKSDSQDRSVGEQFLKERNPELQIRVGQDEYDLYLSVNFVDFGVLFGEWQLTTV